MFAASSSPEHVLVVTVSTKESRALSIYPRQVLLSQFLDPNFRGYPPSFILFIVSNRLCFQIPALYHDETNLELDSTDRVCQYLMFPKYVMSYHGHYGFVS